MIVVGFTGLHGAGKSYAAHRLHAMSKWLLVHKLATLKRVYDAAWQRADASSWEEWYRDIYQRVGGDVVMRRILEEIGEQNVCILDAVHSPAEWRAIVARHPSSLLVGVFSPAQIRQHRRNEPGGQDVRRVGFWHQSEDCLLTYVDWAVSGTLSHDLLNETCRELVAYVDSTLSSTSPP
ncbi:hypothetical protein A3B32_02915 [Candidatus Uhrbacteria bacterium RIFCSPLOWO2_01_FULL_53_9]|uniref:Uncharacterized protein n=3 Tax=Candidatus Uhriibacteriota TaxID=1752732 RepID=A0A1F7V045_9BACT|nr:MAG: hypothetical protein A3C17_04315 [Candidatus Uhrbacteria bacterium RIFCSPHIGHO2_02_FULL_53_13]OGL83354.1 MAG: hypothetical protein A3B32_02915 [Candidatus Uhrbacteria bacterium RIFCSPLOWO2_01_FULL_53_9]